VGDEPRQFVFFRYQGELYRPAAGEIGGPGSYTLRGRDGATVEVPWDAPTLEIRRGWPDRKGWPWPVEG
jgi:hypothetical protein